MMISLGELGKELHTNGKESGKNPSLYKDIKALKNHGVWGQKKRGNEQLRNICSVPYISNLMRKVLLFPNLHKESEAQRT